MKTNSKRGVVIALGTLATQIKFYDKALPPDPLKKDALGHLEAARYMIALIEKEMKDA